MEYSRRPIYHYKPKKGWINDPNGLVYFQGYYHIFYQHLPDFEVPGKQPVHWGHARTKDFLSWEELPIALYPDKEYDGGGCWSGTAAVKDGILYLFYASVRKPEIQTVSVAYSEDGINFKKYEKNPVIDHYPPGGGPDFRDPAVCFAGDKYYCVMATGNPDDRAARLLIYKSENLFDWEYSGVMCEWSECRYAECPSFMPAEDNLFLLTASVCPLNENHYFSVMYGKFSEGRFTSDFISQIDRGPDQYAGQVFRDHLGRNILITWIPGWQYAGYAHRDVGCMSVPRELTIKNGQISAYPVEEVRHLLKDEDPCLKRTDDGFIIERENREPVIYRGEISELKILRDSYIAEVFINGGQEVYTVLL